MFFTSRGHNNACNGELKLHKCFHFKKKIFSGLSFFPVALPFLLEFGSRLLVEIFFEYLCQTTPAVFANEG